MKKIIRNFSLLALFGIAMGFLEAAVVIYLRKIYYPTGFSFPLNSAISPLLLNIEWMREFFTILMLVCIGAICGKNFSTRFSYFLFSFAIWDIFYYIWLKVILGWPPSLFTWDTLFLIPLPWAGPVLAPIIISLTMILLSLSVVYFNKKGYSVKGTFGEWFLCIGGAFFIFISFIWNYAHLIIKNRLYLDFLNLATNKEFYRVIGGFVPTNYCWWLFAFGEILILLSFSLFYRRIMWQRPFM